MVTVMAVAKITIDIYVISHAYHQSELISALASVFVVWQMTIELYKNWTDARIALTLENKHDQAHFLIRCTLIHVHCTRLIL